MSSGQHTPRRAPSLRDLSRHDLKAILSNDQQRTADVRPIVSVAKIGRDIHLARNPGSDKIYRVGGPAISFRPGTILFAGSNSGRPGESIIALPSPAQRGASAYPESRFGGSIDFPAPEDPPEIEVPLVCPTQGILGKNYLGVYFDSGFLYAYSYADHVYGAEIASIAHPYGSTVRWGERADDGAEWVVGKGDPSSGNVKVFSWDIDSNTLYEVDTGHNGFVSDVIGPVVGGSTIYFAVHSGGGNTVTLFSSSLGGTTKTNLGSLTDAGISWSTSPRAMAVAGSTVLVQGFESGRAAGDRAVWSDPVGGTLRISTFHEDRRWQLDGREGSGGIAIGWGLWAQADELQTLGSGGIMTTLASLSVWPDLSAGFALNPSGTQVAWYPQTSEGGINGTIFRVEIKDWTSLSGCTVNGTSTVEDIPDQFSSPDAMFPRD